MDVLYLVGPGDDNEPLRYSLRSLANLADVGRVWVAGHCPDWVTNVEHVHVRQHGESKANESRNLVAALSEPDFPERFVLMNDDFFIMRPRRNVQPTHRGPLEQAIRDNAGNTDAARLTAAAHLLRQWGHDNPLSYDIHHTPIPLLSAATLDALSRAGKSPASAAYRTLAGNASHIGGRRTRDHKIRHQPPPGWRTWAYVSTGARTWQGTIGQAIRQAWPHPGPHEAD